MASVTQYGRVLTKDVGTATGVPFWDVADINADGRPDIVVGTTTPFAFQTPPVRNPDSPVQVLLNTPTGFVDGTGSLFGRAIPKVTLPTAVHVADFAGNGAASIFMSDTGLDRFPWPGASQHLFISSGSSLVDASAKLDNPPEGPAYAHSSAVADINHDGRPDIYVGSLLASSDPYFLINQGNGNFSLSRANLPAQWFESQTLSGSGSLAVTDGRRWAGSALVDVNKDGAPDLVLGALDGTANNVVLLNNGRGDFTQSPAIILPIALYGAGRTTRNGNDFITTGTINWKIVPIDLNHDGYTDLAIAETHRIPGDFDYVGGRLQILMNQGGAGFVDVTSASLPDIGPTLGMPEANRTFFYDLVADDLYGTGSESLVVYISRAGGGYGTIILENDGQGISPAAGRPASTTTICSFRCANRPGNLIGLRSASPFTGTQGWLRVWVRGVCSTRWCRSPRTTPPLSVAPPSPVRPRAT